MARPKKEIPSTRIVVTIPDPDKKKLDELSKADSRSISGLVAKLIHDYVTTHSADSEK